MCRPITATQTVSGVASSSPTGPQSQVQKTTAVMMAMGASPALLPYSQGSMTQARTDSIAKKTPSVQATGAQLSVIAKARIAGIAAATQTPAYGTNRSTMPS